MPQVRKSKWEWNPPREEAAMLIAASELTNNKIAKQLGIAEKTLYDWLAVPEFSARITALRAEIREQIVQRGIAVVENRVARKQADWERLRQIQIERQEADDYRLRNVPGGTTGLLIRDEKAIGSGLDQKFVSVYRIDTALLSELHRLEESVAAELGQRVTKTEVETHDTTISEELVTKLENLAKRHAGRDATPEVQDVPA